MDHEQGSDRVENAKLQEKKKVGCQADDTRGQKIAHSKESIIVSSERIKAGRGREKRS